MSDTAPLQTRPQLPYVGSVPVNNVTPDDVSILGNGFAVLQVGPVEFYMTAAGDFGAAKRRRQLEEIQQLGAAIVGRASAAIELLDLTEAVA